MEYFVKYDSIVRRIWGKSDTVLFIFAGAAAEFALNKAVDWLYFTGRLPADPLGRLFSTVSYARTIVFSEKQAALQTIDAMANIHRAVEEKRGTNIPDWAYRDVLFMLIDYSIRSFEVLERESSKEEKYEVFRVFYQVGDRMGLKDLPSTFEEWQQIRQEHIHRNLQHSHYTENLYKEYRKHLGVVRYRILLETQKMMVPQKVLRLLGLRKTSLLLSLIELYKLSRLVKADWIFRALILPTKYKSQIRQLDALPAYTLNSN